MERYPTQPTDRPQDPGVAVLLLGCDACDEVSSLLEPEVTVLSAQTREEALDLLGRRDVAVLCLGEQVSGALAQRFLGEALSIRPSNQVYNVVLSAGSAPELFQDFIDNDQLFYLTRKPPPPAAVQNILRSAVARYLAPAPQAMKGPADDDWANFAQRVLDLVQHLSLEATVDGIPALVAQDVAGLLAADRARCLVYDPEGETLWTRHPGDREERRESASAGLVSYVVRTGTVVELEHVGDDPRYDPEADNDCGACDERFLAAPVFATAAAASPGMPPGVSAVAVALRAASRPPFSRRDRERLVFVAEQLAPVFSRSTLQRQLNELATRRHGALRDDSARVFRREALDHHGRGFGDQSRLLRISPSWTPWAFRMLLAVFASMALYGLLGSIDEYAAGPAVIRIEGHTEVTATAPGTVTAVEVEDGQNVDAGQLLVRFYGAQELAERDRIHREFELGLVHRLRYPADRGAERALASLRAQQQHAAARLEARTVRAPHPGRVSDLRIRPGQHVAPGQTLLALAGSSSERSVVAMLPGHYRPLIEPGMPIRLELRGHRYAYQRLVIDRIGNEVLGPAEVRRFLGASVGDAVPLNGPLVLAYARLPDETFESGGRAYEYHDGLQGTVEVRVRKESLLSAVLPGLKALKSSTHG